jgi:ABC-type multidrug transport system ATPase subunit
MRWSLLARFFLINGAAVWVDQRESFYCDLTKCDWSLATSHDKNVTNYGCEKVQCECIPGRALCGEGGFIDLGEFLKQEIKGPAKFSCDSSMNSDQCMFSEPNMNGIITSIFGDETILLDCSSGECLHKSEVPGYTRPVKTINKPLIAFAIAGSALFLVMAVLALWWMSRRASQRVGNGPISLDDDDQALNLITEHNPAALHFRNISYFVNGRQILKNVRGAVSPGKVMAIMGASGAGKTTFLDLLARKNKRGQVNGDFFVNGSKVSDTDYKGIIGFVDQEDTMLATLTVYETILNSALLRLPKDMAYEAKNKRVMEVIAQLGITGIKDQMIGSSTDNAVRGISGGEKRRVGIACELVTSPSILFLDEPTSGLDSFNAYNVIECLVNLAKNYQRTVIFTIHQPKSNIVALFDELVLLAKGECVYSGPFNKCQDYFDTQGYPCPPGFNIADYLVDLTVHAEQRRAFPVDDLAPINGGISAVKHNNAKAQHLRPRKRGSSIRDLQAQQLFTRKSTDIPSRHFNEDGVILSEGMMSPRASVDEAEAHLLPSARKEMDRTDLDVLIESYNTSDIGKAIQDEFENASTGQPNSAAGINGVSGLGNGKVFERLGWIGQFMILSQRTWKNLYRNPMLMLAHYAVSIVLAVLCGYLFFAVRDDISGFQNRLGLFFFILALFGFSTLTSLNVFAHERTLFLRERANGYYAPITYFTAKVLFDVVPLRIIPPIIMGMIVYPMVGLVSEWPEFFKFIIVLVLFNLAASAICLFIGIVCKDNSVGNLVGSLVMLFSLLFAGLLLNHNSIPSGALWLQRLSIFHYAFEALIVNEVRYLSLVEHK